MKRLKIGDKVRVTSSTPLSDMSVRIPNELVIINTRIVNGEEWYGLEDPKTLLYYCFFAPSELEKIS